MGKWCFRIWWGHLLYSKKYQSDSRHWPIGRVFSDNTGIHGRSSRGIRIQTIEVVEGSALSLKKFDHAAVKFGLKKVLKYWRNPWNQRMIIVKNPISARSWLKHHTKIVPCVQYTICFAVIYLGWVWVIISAVWMANPWWNKYILPQSLAHKVRRDPSCIINHL